MFFALRYRQSCDVGLTNRRWLEAISVPFPDVVFEAFLGGDLFSFVSWLRVPAQHIEHY